jgi:NRPS condensation-like uncharacterized protein
MSFAPKTIPFNIIDRSYLISEAETVNSAYFPMSPVTIIKLKRAFSQEAIITAFQTIATNYPQLRLGYELDYKNVRWQRVSESKLADYLAACVHVLADNRSIEELVEEAISVNNTPLSQPFNIFIARDYLFFRIHHSFGDGKFFLLLMQYLLAELQEETVDKLPLSNDWWKPIWRIIWQDLGQGSRILWQFVKSLLGYYHGYQQDTQEASSSHNRSPIVSGSAMKVRFKTISADCLAQLNDLKQGVSLNTLLQMMVSEQLLQLGMIGYPITYTIPVDLRRYLNDSALIHPSNLATQIRITLDEGDSLLQSCMNLQNRVVEQLQNRMPLVGIFGEWLLAISGNKTYQSVNRDWLLKSTHNDPRVFVLSNLGNIDAIFADVEPILAEDFAPHILVPLMGSPSLVFVFNTHKNQGHITLTYDPQVFSEVQIGHVLQIFENPFLENITHKFNHNSQIAP